MAAVNMVGSSGSDSDSDSEEQARLKEAAVDIPASPMVISPEKTSKSETKFVFNPSKPARIKPDKPSLRPKDEEKIESELETTPEFRNFVAKKLSAIMDGCFEVDQRIGNHKEAEHSQAEIQSDKDQDFKLFSTSIPGFEPVAEIPRRKRPVEASSSSEGEEERLQSAAVSGDSILENRDSWIQITRNERNADPKKVVKVDHLIGIKTSLKKKKKKKKKNSDEANGTVKMDCDLMPENSTSGSTNDCNVSMESVGDVAEDTDVVSIATQAGHKAKHKSDVAVNKS